MPSLGLLLLFAATARRWTPAGCFSSGKVSAACGCMDPQHGVPGRTGDGPFQLHANATTFGPTDRVKVVLSGHSYFRGFLLEARDAAAAVTQGSVGSFILTDPTTTQLLSCDGVQGAAVSHKSNTRQTRVVAVWVPPQDPPAVVQFFMTVVESYHVFWEKQPGPVVRLRASTPRPPQTPPSTPTPSVLPGPFSLQGCGRWKSCLLDPPGCDPKQSPACFFLSWSMQGNNTTAVLFELSGPAEGYVAFALSWDTWMGDDDVYMCVKDGDGVLVSTASVSGRTHPERRPKTGLSSVSWRLVDGVIQCAFSRPSSPTNQNPGFFDLDQDYFLFLAHGHASERQHLRKHHLQPLISSSRTRILGPAQVLRGSRGPAYLKVHGVLMLVAWMGTGSVGTFIAIFFKADWPNRSLFGQKIWFQVHRGLMLLTVGLTSVAFSLPFVYRGGWSQHAGAHPYLGCCVLSLSLLQPLAAAARPSPDSDRRLLFSRFHLGVGSVLELAAAAAMFLGVGQSTLPLPQPWATLVLIGYLAWLAFFRLLLLVHRSKHRFYSAEVHHRDHHHQSERSPWMFSKLVLLAVLVLGNCSFLVALLSSMAQL